MKPLPTSFLDIHLQIGKHSVHSGNASLYILSSNPTQLAFLEKASADLLDTKTASKFRSSADVLPGFDPRTVQRFEKVTARVRRRSPSRTPNPDTPTGFGGKRHLHHPRSHHHTCFDHALMCRVAAKHLGMDDRSVIGSGESDWEQVFSLDSQKPASSNRGVVGPQWVSRSGSLGLFSERNFGRPIRLAMVDPSDGGRPIMDQG